MYVCADLVAASDVVQAFMITIQKLILNFTLCSVESLHVMYDVMIIGEIPYPVGTRVCIHMHTHTHTHSTYYIRG